MNSHNYQQPAAAQEAVAYLDIGAGGYLDIGSDLPEEQLLALPNGRHALGIIGTYGIDGYVSAPVTAAPAVAYMVDGRVEQGLTFDKAAAETMALANAGTVRPLGFVDGTPAAPGIDLLVELVNAIKMYRLSASTTNRSSVEQLDAVLALIERADASQNG